MLGRRSRRKNSKRSHTFILVIRPPAQPPQLPPVIRWKFEPSDDGSGPFGELREKRRERKSSVRAVEQIQLPASANSGASAPGQDCRPFAGLP
jgi:hypothetical protein